MSATPCLVCGHPLHATMAACPACGWKRRLSGGERQSRDITLVSGRQATFRLVMIALGVALGGTTIWPLVNYLGNLIGYLALLIIPLGRVALVLTGWALLWRLIPRARRRAVWLLCGGALIVVAANAGMGVEATITNIRRAWTVHYDLARAKHAAIRLLDGRVLVAGGQTKDYDALATVVIYDPARSVWTRATSMNVAWQHPAMALLSDGSVLVAGGAVGFERNPIIVGQRDDAQTTAERYDPATNTWRLIAWPDGFHYLFHLAPLPGGSALAMGKREATTGQAQVVAARYDPTLDRWLPVTYPTTTDLPAHLIALKDDSVLVLTNRYGGRPLVERYDPVADAWLAVPTPEPLTLFTSAIRLADGRVLVLGGSRDRALESAAMIYDPVENTWSSTEAAPDDRMSDDRAVLLEDGRVVLLTHPLTKSRRAMLYDPSADMWTPIRSPITDRQDYTLTTLADGTVLAVGGRKSVASLPHASAEIYDPVSDNWVMTSSLDTAR